MVTMNFLKLGATPDSPADATLAFSDWTPDLIALNAAGTEALNVLPSEGGYVPMKDLTVSPGLSLPSRARGAIALPDRNGNTQLYAGTVNGLYLRAGSAFTSQYTTSGTLSDLFQWQFVPFGIQLVAIHPQVAPVATEVGGGSPFTPLGGSPPVARCGAGVGDFLVLGNLDNEPDTPQRQPSRIRWSAFENIDLWGTDPATQADFQDMPAAGGEVTAIVGREVGTVFQTRAISRMTYVGLPAVWQIDTVEYNHGAISTGSVVDLGGLTFFISDDGFRVWNGTNSAPIADNRVNRWFYDRLNYVARARIVGAADFINQCILWAFPTGTSNDLSDIIIYSYKENKFTHAQIPVEYLVTATPGFNFSLEDLTGNLDTDYPLSFDDPFYLAGKPQLGGFGMSHNFGFFAGDNLAATIDTGEFTAPSAKRVVVDRVFPTVDVSSPVVTVQVAGRDQLLGEALTFSAEVPQEKDGTCPVLFDARYGKFRVNIPRGADWHHAVGVQVWRHAQGSF